MPKYGEIIKCSKTGHVGAFVCKSDRYDGVYCVRTADGGYAFFEYIA